MTKPIGYMKLDMPTKFALCVCLKPQKNQRILAISQYKTQKLMHYYPVILFSFITFPFLISLNAPTTITMTNLLLILHKSVKSHHTSKTLMTKLKQNSGNLKLH